MKSAAICSIIFLSVAAAQAAAAQEFPDLQPAAPAAQAQDFEGYKYVGNNFSLKFHRPSCLFAKRMWAQRIVLFRYRKEAIDRGFAPCRYCLPPFWTTVHAVLLPAKATQP